MTGRGRPAVPNHEPYSVRQSLEETIKPALSRLETKVESIEKQVDSLNIKFYGVLGGGGLGAVVAIAKTLGWF